ncbi:hypothetical protein NKH18_28390 [Streptomyces sp. M10(2022)]
MDIGIEPGGGATDLSSEDNFWVASVTAVNTADFSVRGARVSGAVGDTVQTALTFRNKGPGWLGNLGSGDSVARVGFTVPEGVTVTGAPAECLARTLDGDSYRAASAPRAMCVRCRTGCWRTRPVPSLHLAHRHRDP